MAEVFGPIGFCLGALGFICGTLPTLNKDRRLYLDCDSHFNTWEVRLAGLDGKYRAWQHRWRNCGLEKHDLVTKAKRNIENLCKKLDSLLQKQEMTKKEKEKWVRVRKQLYPDQIPADPANVKTYSMVRWSKAPKEMWYRLRMLDADAKFRRSLAYAFWQKKDFIDGWFTEAEKNIEAILWICRDVVGERSAGQLDENSSEDKIAEFMKLEVSQEQISTLAGTLYDECIGTERTYNWGLGLPSPRIGEDVASRKFDPSLEIELRFAVRQPEKIEIFHLHVPCQTAEGAKQISKEHVMRLISQNLVSDNRPNAEPLGAKCEAENTNFARTHSLGRLFHEKPELFRKGTRSWRRWRLDRLDIVRGLLNWSLLLWGTKWTNNLCCYGLQVEKDANNPGDVIQVLTPSRHHECGHNDLRLRNLGIVLAQILLATPIRSNKDDKVRTHEQWVNGQWKQIERKDVYNEVYSKTLSGHLRQAIWFCLEHEGRLTTDVFKSGFVLRCMEEVYKPVNDWYNEEAAKVKNEARPLWKVEHTFGYQEWPKAAMMPQEGEGYMARLLGMVYARLSPDATRLWLFLGYLASVKKLLPVAAAVLTFIYVVML